MTSLGKTEIKAIFGELKIIMVNNRDNLIELDSVMGDGDLGLTMEKSFTAAYETAQAGTDTDLGKFLIRIGMAMAKAAPSTMGTLMATGFMKGGKAVSGKESFTINDIAKFFRAFSNGIMAAGKTKPGNKTIIDVLDPAATALEKAANDNMLIEQGLNNAYKAALKGVKDSKPMKAQHGRAAYYQEKSIGVQDPGATAGALLLKGFYNAVGN